MRQLVITRTSVTSKISTAELERLGLPTKILPFVSPGEFMTVTTASTASVADLNAALSNMGLEITREVPDTTVSTHVFQGNPDGRQSDRVDEPVSRFRPRYRALTAEEKSLHDALKSKAAELEALFEQVKPGRYRSLGFTALEEAVMWTVKELTA
ncbi:MAG: hypothetical protein DI601_00340 [Azospirillum brasilense]|nr:MAG: hypothetical protein DI601_00340 [Azospirillum brasilense]